MDGTERRSIEPIGLTVALDETGEPVAVYLGYRLPLSRAEARLLHGLVAAGGREVPMDALQAAAGAGHAVSREAVSVLVGRINRKAEAIGGRSLIRGRSYHGFSLSDEA